MKFVTGKRRDLLSFGFNCITVDGILSSFLVLNDKHASLDLARDRLEDLVTNMDRVLALLL